MKITKIITLLAVFILASHSGSAQAKELFSPYARTEWEVKSSNKLSADITVASNNLLYCPVGSSIICYDINSGSKLWEQKLNLSGKISHPLIIKDQNIYATGTDGVQQLKLNGSLNWTFKISPLKSGSCTGTLVSPGPTDLLYVGADDTIYGLDPGKNFIWRYSDQKNILDSLSDERAVYVCEKDKKGETTLIALDTKGERIWSRYLGKIKNVHMGMGPNQNLYVITNPTKLDKYSSGKVRCIDVASGNIVWDYTVKADNLTQPSFSSNQKIVFSGGKKLYCLDAITGSCQWNLPLINLASGASIDNTNKRIYVGTSDGRVFSVSFIGKVLWGKQFDDKDAVSLTPVTLKDGGILIYTDKGVIMKIIDIYKE